ncbi:MAG: right-handed parallel beta-helix repeat-containing protein, partial [Thermoplasmata archaeon]
IPVSPMSHQEIKASLVETILKGNPEIVQNIISDNKEGISVTSIGAPTIRNNTIEGNTDYGIHVTSNQTFNIEQNNDIANSTIGIFIEGDAQPIVNNSNSIHHNDYGIKVQDGNIIVEDHNRIWMNDYGVYLDTASTPQLYNNNTIETNTVGIWVAPSTYPVVNWNNIANNTNLGVNKSGGSYFDCECNWWKDDGGPNDPSNDPLGLYNPNPDGENVTDYVDYDQWWRKATGKCDGSP